MWLAFIVLLSDRSDCISSSLWWMLLRRSFISSSWSTVSCWIVSRSRLRASCWMSFHARFIAPSSDWNWVRLLSASARTRASWSRSIIIESCDSCAVPPGLGSIRASSSSSCELLERSDEEVRVKMPLRSRRPPSSVLAARQQGCWLLFGQFTTTTAAAHILTTTTVLNTRYCNIVSRSGSGGSSSACQSRTSVSVSAQTVSTGSVQVATLHVSTTATAAAGASSCVERPPTGL
uniref:Uncharacterized protein n=1 Tax=Anopheles merus TaxID=30066 RepID=A0A182URA0_ANOME